MSGRLTIQKHYTVRVMHQGKYDKLICESAQLHSAAIKRRTVEERRILPLIEIIAPQ